MSHALKMPYEPKLSRAEERAVLLKRIFCYIDEHYFECDISLQDVAESAHYSSAYLTNLVKKMTGQSVRQWIIERRISAARRLLATNDDDLPTIAARLGFHDVSYFCRCFARVTGSTPGQWRTARRAVRPFRSVPSSAFFWYAAEIDYAAPAYALLQRFRKDARKMADALAIAQSAVDTAFAALSPALVQFVWHDEAHRTWVPGYQQSRRSLPSVPQTGDTFGAYPTLIGGQTICAHQLENEENAHYRFLAKMGFRALIATPVAHDERCLGAIVILESRQRRFTMHEQGLAHLLGRYAGHALSGTTQKESTIPA